MKSWHTYTKTYEGLGTALVGELVEGTSDGNAGRVLGKDAPQSKCKQALKSDAHRTCKVQLRQPVVILTKRLLAWIVPAEYWEKMLPICTCQGMCQH